MYYSNFLKFVITRDLPSSLVVTVFLPSICLYAFQPTPFYSPVFIPETQMSSTAPTYPRHPVLLPSWMTSRLSLGINVWFQESDKSSYGPTHSLLPALRSEFLIWDLSYSLRHGFLSNCKPFLTGATFYHDYQHLFFTLWQSAVVIVIIIPTWVWMSALGKTVEGRWKRPRELRISREEKGVEGVESTLTVRQKGAGKAGRRHWSWTLKTTAFPRVITITPSLFCPSCLPKGLTPEDTWDSHFPYACLLNAWKSLS